MMTRAAAALFVAAAWLAGAVLGWNVTGLLGRVWAVLGTRFFATPSRQERRHKS